MAVVPSGRVHNLINIAVYSGLSALVLIGSRQGLVQITPMQALHFSLGFLSGTFLLSPDLDLAEGRVNSKANWGLLGFLWVPYGHLFSHRGLSHTWLVGPVTRLIYLALLVGLVVVPLYLWVLREPLPTLPQPISLKVFVPLLIGYFLSQWLHLIADGVWPDHGMRRARRRR